MTTSPALDQAMAPLKAELARLQGRITQLERNQRAAQLGFSSVENGNITFNDANGNPQLVSGLQPDGTFAHTAITANVPPQPPDQPLAGPGVLSLWVYWDGLMADGSGPLADFDHIEVHCSAVPGFTPSATTLQGTMSQSGLFGVGNLLAGATYYAGFLAVNNAGNTSGPSLYASAVPSSVPANISPGQISALMLQTGSITAAQIAAEAGILGSQIANNTITAGNIVAGTITAGLLAAGIVYAGIVNGTTIIGATIIADGPAGQFLAYTGGPTTGNLIASISGAAGTDNSRNPYDAGINAYTQYNGAAYAVGLNQAGGPLGLPGMSIQSLVQPPATAPGVFGQGSATAATAVLWSGGATTADTGAYVAVLSATQSGNGSQVQIGAKSLQWSGGSGTPASTPGNMGLYVDANGVLWYTAGGTPSGDGNSYRSGYFVVVGALGQLINSVSPAVLVSVANVDPSLRYHIQGYVNYTGSQAAGFPTFGFNGTSTLTHIDGVNRFITPGAPATINAGVYGGATIGNQNGPTLTTAGQRYEFDMWFTFNTAGTFNLRAQEGTSGDAFTINSAYLRVETY